MRILLLSPGFPPMVGGGERYAWQLARQLARRGHAIVMITTAARQTSDFWQGRAIEPRWQDEDDVRVLRLPIAPMPGGRAGLLAWRRAMIALSALPGDPTSLLERMARRVPPVLGLEAALNAVGPQDIAHAFNLSWECPAVAGARLARARGLPLVVTPFAHLATGLHSRLARNNTMRHQVALLRDAAAVLTLTAVEADGLAELGVSRERLRVVGAGLGEGSLVTSREFIENEAIARREGSVSAPHGAAEDGGAPLRTPYALFIGRLAADKGALVACQAVLWLRTRGRDVRLALVGESTPEFERYWRRLDARAREGLLLLGRVDEARKHALLAGAQVLLLPSQVESFGLVVLEAWSHGIPVIGARAGGLAGLIEHDRTGLLVAPGDADACAHALASLLDEPERARALGEAGRATLPEHTWERVADRVERAYAAALGSA